MRRIALFVLLSFSFSLHAGSVKPGASAIASAHPLATAAGHEILTQGGNAFDAAVAVAAALAVVEPYNSGLGGGGFWLLHRESDGFQTMVDARERAPFAASETLYQDERGNVVPNLSLSGALAAAIPGTPAALAHVAHRYGKLPLATSLTPAIRYAKEGYLLSAYDIQWIARLEAVVRGDKTLARLLLDGGFLPEPGHKVVQPELAETLERLAQFGACGFYRGEVAKKLVDGVRAAGGIWTMKDLEAYEPVERRPLRGVYRDMKITTVALPSAGGLVLLQAFALLNGTNFNLLDSSTRQRYVVEALRLANRDRAQLGDPDFVKVPVTRLLSNEHLAKLKNERFVLPQAEPDSQNKDGHTTHFSIIDRDGNRVAATLSLNRPFGAGVSVPGTGVWLNNEMDDFAAKPGVPNLYGLVGSRANAIAPGKRPLSSMTPTFLETADAVLVLGSPGGSRIPSTVFLAALAFANDERDAQKLVDLPRYHHQYLPNVVEYEPAALDGFTRKNFAQWGYGLKERERFGNLQAVLWNKALRGYSVASDARGQGAAVVK
jgi:gamma-glutamyltranspeptidase/glutathione hydrolase